MAVNPLSDLTSTGRHWTVQVYVSRLWQHRGGQDEGPIKHTDMVLLDTQGNHMYGEVSDGLVDMFIDRLQEGKVYELKRFLVVAKKRSYRAVEGQYMIRFCKYTSVVEMNGTIMDYPLCTYALTPLDELPRPVDMPESFTDVVGIITGVSPAAQYHSAYRATSSIKRVVYLSDINGYKVSLILWGERALAFDGDGVLQSAQKEAVVAIFVGTLVKPYEGQRGLSGSAPCRWYINEDLPEINELRTRLKEGIPVIESISLPGQSAAEISAQVDLETKTVAELVDLNIWDHDKTKFFCTVVITKLSPGQRWWFSSCTTCHKTTVPFGTGYRCSDTGCVGKGAMPRYRICYVGSDGTGEVELVLFDRVGKEMVGKPLLSLLRAGLSQSTSLEEVMESARSDQSTPRELAAVVSKKYRLVVSVTSKSFEATSDKPSYQVHRIDVEYGKQSNSSTLRRGPGLALASSSNSGDSGLSSSGIALANLAALTQSTSSAFVTTSAEATATTDTYTDQTPAGLTLPSSPPSVVKPVAGLKMRAATDLSVKKPLFQDGSQVEAAENSLLVGVQTPEAMDLAKKPLLQDSGSQVVVDETSQGVKDGTFLPDCPVGQLPVSTLAATEVPEEALPKGNKNKRRKQLSAKEAASSDAKKKKS